MRCKVWRSVIGVIAALSLTTALAGQSAEVHISDAWIRWLPGDAPAGGYLTIVNDGHDSVTLVAVSSPAYRAVSLHQSVTEQGVSKMIAVDTITIGAHSRLEFAAGGYHLMLERAKTTVKPSDHVPVTLRFADGQSVTAEFKVREPGAIPTPSHGSRAQIIPPMPDMPDMPDMPGMPSMHH